MLLTNHIPINIRRISLSVYILLVFIALPNNLFAQFGVINTVAGNGTAAFGGDGSAATSANLNTPLGIWVDGAGNLYIADQANNRVRKVTAATGLMSTIAGNGTAGSIGDGGPALAAELHSPSGLCMDLAGNLYVGDLLNNKVRKITPGGIITTVAGTGTAGFSGDGGLATAAQLNHPYGVWVDAANNIYITDQNNHRIRKVNGTTGNISTIAGNGATSFCCDGSPATAASFSTPTGIVVDGAGIVYFSTQGGDARVRKIDLAGIIHTEEGNGTTGFTGDCGPATNAEIWWPQGLGIDGAGNVYLATSSDYRVREVVSASGIIHTVAGSGGTAFSGDGGPALAAGMVPYGVFIDGANNIYISGENRVRRVTVAHHIDTLGICTGTPMVLGSATTYADSVRWNTGATTPSISITAPGTYWIKQFVCTYTAIDTYIVNSINPVVNLGPDTTICTGGSLPLSSSITYPAGATYLWNTGSTTSTISAASTGTFWLNVTVSGCSGRDSVLVHYHNIPVPTISGTNVYCQHQTYVPPTAAGVNILWYTAAVGGVGAATAPIINTNVPGTYTIYASQTDTGCESNRASFVITVHPKPVAPVITDIPSYYCAGRPFSPFTVVSGTGILWYTTDTGGVGSAVSPTVNTTLPGSYTVYASQTVLGCESDRANFTVIVYDSLEAAFNFVVHYGCSADTVAFLNTSVGASNYVWQLGNGTSSIVPTPTVVYPHQAIDTVKLVVSNTKCIDSAIHMINLVHPVRGHFSVDTNLICQGQSINFTDASFAGPLSYLWIFGDGGTSVVSSPAHTFAHAGTFTAMEIVTNFVPCSDTAYLTLVVDSTSPLTINLSDSVVCLGGHLTVTGNYSNMGLTGVVWTLGDGKTILDANPVEHAYSSPGTYVVQATANYQVCPTLTATKTVVVQPQPTIYLGHDTAICKGGQPFTIIDSRNFGNPAATWRWNTGATTPSITVIEPGTYTATVIINGCDASSSINISNDCYVNIPNVFTPNGDNVNDYFLPRELLTKGLLSFSMKVYNRWGQQVFATISLEGQGWDGMLNSTPQPEGVYVYVIDCTFKDGQKELYKGNVTLLR